MGDPERWERGEYGLYATTATNQCEFTYYSTSNLYLYPSARISPSFRRPGRPPWHSFHPTPTLKVSTSPRLLTGGHKSAKVNSRRARGRGNGKRRRLETLARSSPRTRRKRTNHERKLHAKQSTPGH